MSCNNRVYWCQKQDKNNCHPYWWLLWNTGCFHQFTCFHCTWIVQFSPFAANSFRNVLVTIWRFPKRWVRSTTTRTFASPSDRPFLHYSRYRLQCSEDIIKQNFQLTAQLWDKLFTQVESVLLSGYFSHPHKIPAYEQCTKVKKIIRMFSFIGGQFNGLWAILIRIISSSHNDYQIFEAKMTQRHSHEHIYNIYLLHSTRSTIKHPDWRLRDWRLENFCPEMSRVCVSVRYRDHMWQICDKWLTIDHGSVLVFEPMKCLVWLLRHLLV